MRKTYTKSETFTCKGFGRTPHQCKPSEFYTDNARRGGGRSYLCKECHKARSREYFKSKYYPSHKSELIEAVAVRRKEARTKP